MRTPAFWWRPRPSLLARLLQPIGFIYGAITAHRMGRPGAHPPCPVVCIGNLTAGGAGKTPVAIAVADLLRAHQETPHVLSRGYGGHLAGPVVVVPDAHEAADVGDEPLIIARHVPVVVSRDRPAGARLAKAEGASVIVMDDGLQNPSLAKSVTFAVVDGAAGFGNGLCVPAGPLRAPLTAQLPHIDAFIAVGQGPAHAAIPNIAGHRPIFTGDLIPDTEIAAGLRGTRVLAFAGIGRPEKFFATLRHIGAEVVGEAPFGDHRPYRPADLQALAARAAALDAQLVTTEKDAARLGDDIHRLPGLLILPVRFRPDDATGLAAFLMGSLRKTKNGSKDPA
ncbi:tetraacyldisaccharide 4'-kinase [Chelatococcus asaccharovorans]|uniref:Tetraacyldisaccharide 4'-kinase n=1 Tax=Chelatococcus asaccharovorans TaxID=28210 RepID=A0A2V3U4C3_9HYPH|nr:tetraacyldisaccharide 4'-kinase [Chelatococcus asaccharovorans]MBS7702272.1 tetraacyldisaccharide 4'-kinase [Chelatococcus asaccharovorans]PXW56528.1 lipid-A-disaccharide kinase [Chelatococcus asaccharovorans]